MRPNIEIITLVYKSTDYLHLIYNELKSTNCNVPGWDVGVRIVANDPTPAVAAALRDLPIPFTFYHDPDPYAYYLNRVYRCWNFAGMGSEYDNICFVNSDMMFSPGWLTNLLVHHDGKTIPTSRLVESGKMRSGTHGVSRNFGRHPHHLNREGWQKEVDKLSTHETKPGGLFMPCVFYTELFRESGGYPEGNIYKDGIGTGGPKGTIQSGDDWFFKKLKRVYGLDHVTVFDSLVYHIQEGEMDS